MEKIKVNMSPNPLDVQTIHASQNDGEARQWGFELHNNGEKIDSSSISDQLVFKAYKGGTEQILPENTSTPTTSPFKGDIKYPQGLLTDQEFLYRQSPTEEDGLAKITDIKGNTLVWNQLVQNGNFADSSNWYARQTTFTVSNNVSTVTPSTEGTERGIYSTAIPVKANHKYLLSCEIKPPVLSTARVSFGGSINYGFDTVIQASQWSKCQGIVLNDIDRNIAFYSLIRNSLTPSQTIQFRNMMVIDLTQMGLDISNPSDFTSLFPLPYYAYNQGTLLSFMGNGIKTVGKNLNPWIGVDYNASTSRTVFLKKGDYVLSTDTGNNFGGSTQIYFCLADSNGNNITNGGITSGYLSLNDSGTFYYGGYGRNNIPLTLNFDAFVSFGFNNQKPTNFNAVQLEFGSVASNYEPYTSSTLSLPISTYFPTGMKSGGPTYDEMTNSKYVIRTKYIKFDGSQPWSTRTTSGGSVLYEFVPPDIKNVGTQATAQILNNRYPWNTSLTEDKTIRQVSTTISVRRDDITSLQAWYSELANNPLEIVYQLATPIETSITTASLVTENSEIPLSNDDGVLIGKCTEQLSENPGFIDAKIKLADADGECYSNKIQLHIERSPQ